MPSLNRLAPLAVLAAVACQQPPSFVSPEVDAGVGGPIFPWEDAAPPRPDAGGDVGAPLSDAGGQPEADGGSDGAVVPPGAYSVVVLPDTQYYAAVFPQFFDQQTRWIVEQHAAGNVEFVLTEGDIVDDDNTLQWQRAVHSLHMLDGVVPYVLVAGNHDYEGAGWTSNRNSMMSAYFPVSLFADEPSFGGTFEPNRIENNYHLFDVPGGDGQWLVLSLEFGPRDEVLAWADGIVKQHATTPAIVVTHAYLFDDDTRYDYATRGATQSWNPHSYPIGMIPGAANDGEEMWQKLISGNSNIRFVLSGHVLNSGVGRLTSVRPDGSVVHQILANYQNYDMGGDGFLRVMQFFPQQKLVHIRTYSPIFDQFMTDPRNDFVLEY